MGKLSITIVIYMLVIYFVILWYITLSSFYLSTCYIKYFNIDILRQHEHALLIYLYDYVFLQGALYVLSSDTFMMTVWFRRDWESSLKLSPAFLKAHYSEKPSIIKLVDHVLHKIYKNLSHNNISIEVR